MCSWNSVVVFHSCTVVSFHKVFSMWDCIHFNVGVYGAGPEHLLV